MFIKLYAEVVLIHNGKVGIKMGKIKVEGSPQVCQSAKSMFQVQNIRNSWASRQVIDINVIRDRW